MVDKKLVIILVGEDGPSVMYVKRKLLKAAERGISAELIRFDENCPEETLTEKITALNADIGVGGIMVQLPLPRQLHPRTREILNLIDPKKDIDCLTSANLQRLEKGKPKLYPATVMAILSILGEQLNRRLLFEEGRGVLKGKKCAVIGASDLVGRPTALVLKNLGASVTVCDEFTSKNEVILACRGADILVSATGVGHLITKDMVKPGAIVIDVGISRDENGKLIGDVDFDQVTKVASFVSPVPGGVGPRTVEALLDNFISVR